VENLADTKNTTNAMPSIAGCGKGTGGENRQRLTGKKSNAHFVTSGMFNLAHT